MEPAHTIKVQSLGGASQRGSIWQADNVSLTLHRFFVIFIFILFNLNWVSVPKSWYGAYDFVCLLGKLPWFTSVIMFKATKDLIKKVLHKRFVASYFEGQRNPVTWQKGVTHLYCERSTRTEFQWNPWAAHLDLAVLCFAVDLCPESTGRNPQNIHQFQWNLDFPA